ncbi:hypothetical protein MJO28_003344 [Puccinia striiformis f. sp. tritici]|uniref:Uncharacterized protein n=1 Tax=Puccinia striiformis f. sp. tritici TaxID=168172 RepID=A0ACC0EU07_9BASI|nr:hypothetical protein MJO28_003344 [Puccinia striiformis f. sp. tritici]KAI7965305.1 hypothetical protein MJO29_003403 [Puccinia striiformis f. sp. tritici]
MVQKQLPPSQQPAEEEEEDTPKKRKPTKKPTQAQTKRKPSKFKQAREKRKTEDKQKEKPQDPQPPPKTQLCPIKTAALLPPPTSPSKSDKEPEDTVTATVDFKLYSGVWDTDKGITSRFDKK